MSDIIRNGKPVTVVLTHPTGEVVRCNTVSEIEEAFTNCPHALIDFEEQSDG